MGVYCRPPTVESRIIWNSNNNMQKQFEFWMLKSRQKIYKFSIPLDIVPVSHLWMGPDRQFFSGWINSVNIFNRVTNPAASLGFMHYLPIPARGKSTRHSQVPTHRYSKHLSFRQLSRKNCHMTLYFSIVMTKY